MKRIETETTNCDVCGTRGTCAKLGPDGFYTLALCPACHPPLAEQMKADAKFALIPGQDAIVAPSAASVRIASSSSSATRRMYTP
jgi:hypothetical protein